MREQAAEIPFFRGLLGSRPEVYSVKRAMITLVAVLMWGAIGSTAKAQTPAQMAKFCRYLTGHPAVTMELAAAQGMDGPEFLTSYCTAAYESQYARLQYFLTTHPEVVQQLADEQTLGGAVPYQGFAPYPSAPPTPPTAAYQSVPPYAAAPSYQSVYPGQNYPAQNYFGATPDPIGQLAGSAISGLLARFLGNNVGLQNYGGYNGAPGPAPQPPYSAPYPGGP